MNEAQVGISSPERQRQRVSPETAERIREWHEAASQAASGDARSDQTLTYLGLTVVIPQGLRRITGASHLLGEAILATVHADDRVLDIGAGSGVNSVLAATLGARVVAIDISPRACDAAVENVQRSELTDRIDVRQGDLFSGVVGQFDVIVYEPPFCSRERGDLVAAESSDNARAVKAFLGSVSTYLLPQGRILLLLYPPGDPDYLRQLAAESGLTASLVAQERQVDDGRPVDYFAIGLTATQAAVPTAIGPKTG